MDNPVDPTVGYIIYIAISSLIIFCDTPFICLIFGNKHLRSQKELVIIGFMCIADTLHAVAFLVSGSIRLWKTLTGLGAIGITNHDCVQWVFPIIFLYSYQLMGLATLTVSIDRYIAVLMPMYYRVLTSRYSFTVIIGLFLYATLTSGSFMYITHTTPPRDITAMCFTSESYTPGIWSYMLFFRMSTMVFSILLYVPIMYKIVRSASQFRKGLVNSQAYSKKMIRTTRTVGLTVLAELLFVVIPDLILYFNPAGLARWQVIWYLLGVSKGAVNVLLVTMRHDEIVKVLRGKLSLRPSVAPTVAATRTSTMAAERSRGKVLSRCK